MTVVEVMEVSGRHDSPNWLEHGLGALFPSSACINLTLHYLLMWLFEYGHFCGEMRCSADPLGRGKAGLIRTRQPG